jgi:hypothetical protein
MLVLPPGTFAPLPRWERPVVRGRSGTATGRTLPVVALVPGRPGGTAALNKSGPGIDRPLCQADHVVLQD